MKTIGIQTFAALILTGVALVDPARSDEKSNVVTNHVVPALGISFEASTKLLLGHCGLPEFSPDQIEKHKALGLSMPFANTFVLVEREELGEHKLDSVPPGDVAVISLQLRSGFAAEHMKKRFCRDEFELKFGDHTTYKLPACPGPFGGGGYYYLVDLPHGVLDVFAHKHYYKNMREYTKARKEPPRTHYDKDIEAIIKSIRIIKKQEVSQTASSSGDPE